MAIDVKFDLSGNPEPPTIILAKRNGDRLGQLNINIESINLVESLGDVSEISFTLNKYIDEEINYLWDEVKDFRLIYCKEWDVWFEIKVELDESVELVKTVFGTQLGQAELSQTMLYNIEINTEKDIERDDYKISILYSEADPDRDSILHRLLEKAPHYSIAHVDDTLKTIQRSFSFDGESICDAFQKIAEEIGCLFVYNSNADPDNDGRPRRSISVYDLQQNCLNPECKFRGEFTDICPKCRGRDSKGVKHEIKQGYGKDTLIFVTSDELGSEGIEFVTDTDSIKNCFKLEAGDDLMTATVRNCNPNGTDYIWYFSDVMKSDMSEELVNKIESYDVLYKEYYNDRYMYGKRISKKEDKYFTVGKSIKVGDILTFMCLAEDKGKASVSWTETDGSIFGISLAGTGDIKYYAYQLTVTSNMDKVSVNRYVETYLNFNFKQYNALVRKYRVYNPELKGVEPPVKGYSNLMKSYYKVVDMSLYLKSGLMPPVEIEKTTAADQAKLLTQEDLSPVAVANLKSITKATADNAVLAMAKILVKSTYKVQVNNSTFSTDDKVWNGSFVVSNYSDESDTEYSSTISITINDDMEVSVQQKIDKALNKDNTEDLSITGLFKMDIHTSSSDDCACDFCNQLKRYGLNPLLSLRESGQNCIDILVEQGAGKKNASEDSLYQKLYLPYYRKLKAIEAEIKVRESEVAILEGAYNSKGKLTTEGLRTQIEQTMAKIQKDLDFEKYLGSTLWTEFCSYRREDKYTNNNYISDGLNNNELFSKAQEFIKVAESEIYKSSELQHSISTTLNNLLAIEKFKPLVNSFEVGNWIRVQVDDKVYKLRLLKYEIDFGDFNYIPVEFSDVTKIKSGASDIESVLSNASSIASSYDALQKQASQGNDAKDTIEQWLSDGLSTALVQIQNNDTEEITITKNGLLGRSYNDITETHSPEQIKLTHNMMALTDDDWESVKLAVGKHSYSYYDDNGNKKDDGVGFGVSSDFVTAGYISGSQIIGGDIYSDNYSASDETGSYINLRDGTFSFGGGSLRYESGKLIISSPDIPTTETITEINEQYLKTTSVYAQNLQVNAAKINGTITANNIDTDTGNIGGWEIKSWGIQKSVGDYEIRLQSTTTDTDKAFYVGKKDSDNNLSMLFYVNNKGEMSATAGNIGGWKIESSGISKVSNRFESRVASSSNENHKAFYVRTPENDSDSIEQAYDNGQWNYLFSVDNKGHLHAESATIKGEVYASSGDIGKWQIETKDNSATGVISSMNGDYKAYIQTPGYEGEGNNKIAKWVFSIQKTEKDGKIYSRFYADTDGNVVAGGNVYTGGNITFSSGYNLKNCRFGNFNLTSDDEVTIYFNSDGSDIHTDNTKIRVFSQLMSGDRIVKITGILKNGFKVKSVYGSANSSYDYVVFTFD